MFFVKGSCRSGSHRASEIQILYNYFLRPTSSACGPSSSRIEFKIAWIFWREGLVSIEQKIVRRLHSALATAAGFQERFAHSTRLPRSRKLRKTSWLVYLQFRFCFWRASGRFFWPSLPAFRSVFGQFVGRFFLDKSLNANLKHFLKQFKGSRKGQINYPDFTGQNEAPSRLYSNSGQTDRVRGPDRNAWSPVALECPDRAIRLRSGCD